ncbi:MAG UNVERIFIED_CONTAM: hypothetical protein LVR29_01840 [Microcystis novacekii LVE1205-3]|jgi:hypothetical protein
MTAIQLRKSLPTITWEKLSDDFILPDEPVDNNLQPLGEDEILQQKLVEKLR